MPQVSTAMRFSDSAVMPLVAIAFRMRVVGNADLVGADAAAVADVVAALHSHGRDRA